MLRSARHELCTGSSVPATRVGVAWTTPGLASHSPGTPGDRAARASVAPPGLGGCCSAAPVLRAGLTSAALPSQRTLSRGSAAAAVVWAPVRNAARGPHRHVAICPRVGDVLPVGATTGTQMCTCAHLHAPFSPFRVSPGAVIPAQHPSSWLRSPQEAPRPLRSPSRPQESLLMWRSTAGRNINAATATAGNRDKGF